MQVPHETISQPTLRLVTGAAGGGLRTRRTREDSHSERARASQVERTAMPSPGAALRVDDREGASHRVQPLQQHHGPLPEDQG